MGSIPKFLASVVTIIVGVVMCLSLVLSSIVINSARTYHSSVIDHIEASNFDAATIEKCILAAEKDHYNLEVEEITSGESGSYYFYKVTLTYGLALPIFGKLHSGSLVGYAMPGAHIFSGTPVSSDPVPGLYKTGSDYSILIKEWDDLVSEGVITVADGAAGTGFVSGDNASASSLAGDLLFPKDGSVTKISQLAFFKCDKLTGIKLPNNVTTIGKQAFAGCIELTSVELGVGIDSIEYSAFDYCGGINKVVYNGDLAGWCAIDFNSWQSNPVYYGADLYVDGDMVANITIPASVTSLKNVFTGCGSLESVIIPDNCQLTDLDDYAFGRCYNLKNVTIGSNVTKIGQYAFLECDLRTLIVPSSVVEIDANALCYCSSLKDIIYRGTKAEWEAISFGGDWNTNTGEYMIHCTDGVVTKS